MKPIIIHAPAKVNIYLGVQDKVVDGRHILETIVHPVAFGDTVKIEKSKEFEFVMEPEIDVPNEDNLAYVAAIALAHYYKRQLGVKITVTKRIPMQAGLGGGSADAAAVLAGLAHYWGMEIDDPLLIYVAQMLGTDVASLLQSPAAHMDGYGERYRTSYPPLNSPVVLVKPEGSLSTADVYKQFDKNPDLVMPPTLLIAGLEDGDEELAVTHFANNLEPAATELLPEVGDVIAWLTNQSGTFMPHLCGSGSCCFAVCDSDDEARAIAQAAQDRGWWAEATAFSTEGVRIVSG